MGGPHPNGLLQRLVLKLKEDVTATACWDQLIHFHFIYVSYFVVRFVFLWPHQMDSGCSLICAALCSLDRRAGGELDESETADRVHRVRGAADLLRHLWRRIPLAPTQGSHRPQRSQGILSQVSFWWNGILNWPSEYNLLVKKQLVLTSLLMLITPGFQNKSALNTIKIKQTSHYLHLSIICLIIKITLQFSKHVLLSPVRIIACLCVGGEYPPARQGSLCAVRLWQRHKQVPEPADGGSGCCGGRDQKVSAFSPSVFTH